MPKGPKGEKRPADVIGAAITVAKIATQEDIFSEQSRRAFVAETNLNFGMTRMLLAHSESSAAQIEVFRDMSEARRWLGLD